LHDGIRTYNACGAGDEYRRGNYRKGSGSDFGQKTEVLEYVSGLELPERMPFLSPKGILADLEFTLTEEGARRVSWSSTRTQRFGISTAMNACRDGRIGNR
jgi:hypothetical protein